MSKKLLLALWKSRSPEEFVEKVLLPGLRGRSLRSPRGIWGELSGNPEYGGNILRVLRGGGGYPSIIFTERGGKRKEFFYLAMEQFLVGGEGKPRAKTTPNVIVPLQQADFDKGRKAVGFKVQKGIGRSSGELRQVLIPERLLLHDQWSGRVKAEPEGGMLKVELEPEAFRKVMNHNFKESFLKRYLDTISFVGGKINVNEYKKRSQLRTAYRGFHGLYSRYGRFMREAAKRMPREDFAALIEKHLGIGGNFAMEFAKKFGRVLSSQEGLKAAGVIAEHSMHDPWRLPFRPKI